MRKKTVSVKQLTMTALAAVLICVCSWITVPAVIPFTLQTFAVFFVLLVLGGRDGTLAILLFILLGAAGLPVFSGFRGGIGHLLGPTGGYIGGFLLTGLIYWLLSHLDTRHHAVKYIALLLGLFFCYGAGTAWFAMVYANEGKSMRLMAILSTCVFPYVIPDMIKLVMAAVIAERVKKALKRISPEK